MHLKQAYILSKQGGDPRIFQEFDCYAFVFSFHLSYLLLKASYTFLTKTTIILIIFIHIRTVGFKGFSVVFWWDLRGFSRLKILFPSRTSRNVLIWNNPHLT